jgi:hypothetical protein
MAIVDKVFLPILIAIITNTVASVSHFDTGLVTIFLLVPTFYGFLSLFIDIFDWMYTRLERQFFLARLVQVLVYIIAETEKKGDEWTSLAWKRSLLFSLENAARLLGQYWPAQFPCRDAATKKWLRDTAGEMATALREKKKWVITPKKDTCQYFLKSMTTTLIAIVCDDWDAVERVKRDQVEETPQPTPFVSFLRKVVRTGIKVVMPVGVLFAVQQSPFALTGTSFVTAVSMLIFYEIAVVMTILDPEFSARMAMVKNI